MNIEDIYNLCLSKAGAEEAFPFDEVTLVFKVGGKIFALMSLKWWEEGKPAINLKCNPERAEELRAEHPEIIPGYHMSKKHWNTVYCNGNLPSNLIAELIQHSYDLVFNALPKKVRYNITL